MTDTAPARTGLRSRRMLLLMVLGSLCVALPFMGWQATWFGRRLSSRELDRYLGDDRHPRKIQHALSQISDRIQQGDAGAARWYPRVAALSRNPLVPIRNTAAWVMGQDNRSEAFHRALLALLADSEPMVRRNAALSLVRFGDPAGRAELVAILEPYAIRAPGAGTLSLQAHATQQVGGGTVVARLARDTGGSEDIHAPFSGEVTAVAATNGRRVSAGTPLLWLRADASQVWEALRALYLVGQPEDLVEIERQTGASGRDAGRIREQAVLTARAIRSRAEPNPSR